MHGYVQKNRIGDKLRRTVRRKQTVARRNANGSLDPFIAKPIDGDNALQELAARHYERHTIADHIEEVLEHYDLVDQRKGGLPEALPGPVEKGAPPYAITAAAIAAMGQEMLATDSAGSSVKNPK